MIHCRDLHFAYPGDAFALSVAKLSVAEGEAVALVGPSGSGKTTLINLISGILVPASGMVEVDGHNLADLSLTERQRFRIERIGLVPQNFELLDYLTVKENILVPFRVSQGLRLSAESDDRCHELMLRAGIAPLLDRFPEQLSQGERQRVALCRGLVSSPRLILADEPTGNLDPDNQERIVSLLLEEARRISATIVMITHDPILLPRFDRVIDTLTLRGESKA